MRITFSCPLPFGKVGPSTPLTHIRDALMDSDHNVKIITRNDYDIFKYDIASPMRGTAFDLRASYDVGDPDLFIGCPNSSLISMEKMRRAKKVTLWFSSHCQYAYDVLVEEYPKYGIRGPPMHPYEMWKSMTEHIISDVLIVPSETCKQTYIDHHVPEETLRVVNFGVDSKKFHPSEEEHDGFVVLFTGGNYVRKGLGYLMKAWQELDLKDAKLKILGCKVNCTIPNVEILGWIPDERVPEIYRSADIFVLPSLEEGQALAGLEAMSTGLPVIVTKNAGLPIEDGKEGLIIPMRDVEAIKTSLRYFYDNRDEIKRMGYNAKKKAEGMTWQKFKDNFMETLEEL